MFVLNREEKNCSEWASKRLTELFNQIKGEYENTKYSVNKTEKCSGELNWYNRKGKRFILFEIGVTVGWEAEIGEKKAQGKQTKKINE